MGQPVVHFEIICRDPQKLRNFYGDLFEWEFENAERLGGTRRMGPEKNPGGDLLVGHFTDPEGQLIGLAGPA